MSVGGELEGGRYVRCEWPTCIRARREPEDAAGRGVDGQGEGNVAAGLRAEGRSGEDAVDRRGVVGVRACVRACEKPQVLAGGRGAHRGPGAGRQGRERWQGDGWAVVREVV